MESIAKHFEKLITIGEGLTKNLKTNYEKKVDFLGNEKLIPIYKFVNHRKSSRWGTTCLHFLKSIYTDKGEHYLRFKSFSLKFALDRNFRAVSVAIGIMEAAKFDYENQHLFNTRALIEAEVFDDFLEQSEHLLSQGYFTASAVIAGSVLEDSLRKLCIKNGITLLAKPKLDTMNADLAKAGVYNLLKQKQITALADLRNKAAHGQGGFTKEDVESMIKDIRRFMEDYFS